MGGSKVRKRIIMRNRKRDGNKLFIVEYHISAVPKSGATGSQSKTILLTQYVQRLLLCELFTKLWSLHAWRLTTRVTEYSIRTILKIVLLDSSHLYASVITLAHFGRTLYDMTSSKSSNLNFAKLWDRTDHWGQTGSIEQLSVYTEIRAYHWMVSKIYDGPPAYVSSAL